MNNPTLHFLPIIPPWLIAAVCLGLLALLVHGCALLVRKQVPRKWVGILALLRVVIVLLFAVCLIQPVFSYSKSSERLPEMLVLVDASQSMLQPGVGGTRFQEIARTVTSGEMIEALKQRYSLRYYAIDRGAKPVTPSELTGVKPEGDTTRYAESLTAAWNNARQTAAADKSGPAPAPSRVLLAGDGNDLSTQDVADVARRLGLPIDTLAPSAGAQAKSPPRVVIASVQSPRRVLIGSETQFGVFVRREGAVDQPQTLTLFEAGKPLMTQDVTFDPNQNERMIRISYRPPEAGVRQYELRLAPKTGPKPAQEPQPYKVSVQVVDNRHEVLILDDHWRWDFKFLRRIFEDDPSFSFTAFLWRGGLQYSQYGEPDRRVNTVSFPQGRGELEWFDVFVLSDVNPRRWPRGFSQALSYMVAEEGRSLVVMAGPEIRRWVDIPELNALLPVEITAESANPLVGPIEVRLSRDGANSPFFFNPSPVVGKPPAPLPPMDQIYPVLRKKPAASVLLEAAKQGNAYGPLIVMAEHTVGRGRVLYIATDTLWKWQTLGVQNEQGVTPYGAFWQQALRALAPVQTHRRNIDLWMQPDRSRYESGGRVKVTAEIKSGKPISQPTLQSTVILPDGRQIPITFAADPAKPDRFEAEFETSTPGQHRVMTNLLVDGKSEAETMTAIDVDEARSETSATGVDDANLARIAASTGGRRIDLAQKDTWPTADRAQKHTVEQTRAFDLWNNFSLVIALCLLLGVDWAIRLVRGYV